MKRAGRIVFNVLVVLTILSCFATALLWVRSCWVADVIEHEWEHTERWVGSRFERRFCISRVASARGILVARREQGYLLSGSNSPSIDKWFWGHHVKMPDVETLPERFGLFLIHDHWIKIYTNEDDIYIVGVPYWILTPLTGVLAFIGTRRFLRRRRVIATGLCLSCGYDLRATPDRCPECGLIPAEATK